MCASSGQARRPIWVFVSAAWLAPALLAVLKEYARGLIGGGPAADPRLAAFEGVTGCSTHSSSRSCFCSHADSPSKKAPRPRLPLRAGAAILLCAAWNPPPPDGYTWGLGLLYAVWAV